MKKETVRLLKKYRVLYLFLLPGVIILCLFAYAPMGGLVMVFQKYDPVSGFLGSPFVGFDNFVRVFNSPVFGRALKNTVVISSLKLLVGFPLPVLFAILLNELSSRRFRKNIQTAIYLPNFVSWVIVAGVWYSLLAENGVVNNLLLAVGVLDNPVLFMQNRILFYPIIIFTDIWKNMGYGTIFYMATMSSIPVENYEAAMIDGATRYQRVKYITLPALKNTVVLIFILSSASLLNAGFDQMWTMSNLAVRDIADILDTAVLRTLTTGNIGDLSVGATLGLFKSVVALLLFLITNYISRRAEMETIV